MNGLKSLSGKVKRIAGKSLVSMIVFGSYARGDFNGDSDVDLIVVVKKKNNRLIKRFEKLEQELDGKANNWVDKRASKFLNLIGFKKNIFLFDEKEFEKKKFNFCDSQLLAWLLIPKGVIWTNIKNEGKVVYGKDLLDFDSKIGFWDKLKAPLPGVGACVMAALLLPFNKKKAVSLAQTGLRWTYMNVRGILKRSDINSIFGNFVEILKVAFKSNYC
jgi:predicted nucleotidyltransferase